MRDAIEWYKSFNSVPGDFTDLEIKLMNERWAVLMVAIANREGIGAGLCSSMLGEAALAELRLLQTAALEARDALGLADGEPS